MVFLDPGDGILDFIVIVLDDNDALILITPSPSFGTESRVMGSRFFAGRIYVSGITSFSRKENFRRIIVQASVQLNKERDGAKVPARFSLESGGEPETDLRDINRVRMRVVEGEGFV
jgi:hypothetical protein